ncbi:MAG: hypothetical protein HY543_01990 [Deltaproteobacteria bacterium]|nr:hypothetical protein [Deltaproteobacteria bacterium]
MTRVGFRPLVIVGHAKAPGAEDRKGAKAARLSSPEPSFRLPSASEGRKGVERFADRPQDVESVEARFARLPEEVQQAIITAEDRARRDLGADNVDFTGFRLSLIALYEAKVELGVKIPGIFGHTTK